MLGEESLQSISKLTTGHRTKSNVYIMAWYAEQLVAYPTASEANLWTVLRYALPAVKKSFLE